MLLIIHFLIAIYIYIYIIAKHIGINKSRITSILHFKFLDNLFKLNNLINIYRKLIKILC